MTEKNVSTEIIIKEKNWCWGCQVIARQLGNRISFEQPACVCTQKQRKSRHFGRNDSGSSLQRPFFHCSSGNDLSLLMRFQNKARTQSRKEVEKMANFLRNRCCSSWTFSTWQSRILFPDKPGGSGFNLILEKSLCENFGGRMLNGSTAAVVRLWLFPCQDFQSYFYSTWNFPQTFVHNCTYCTCLAKAIRTEEHFHTE